MSLTSKGSLEEKEKHLNKVASGQHRVPSYTNKELRAMFKYHIRCDTINDYAFVYKEWGENDIYTIRDLHNTSLKINDSMKSYSSTTLGLHQGRM